jgi:hypothetical protein
MKMYQVKPRIMGNPDYGQNPNIPPYGVKPKTLSAPTLTDLRNVVFAWRDDNGLGAGNWGTARVFKDGKEFGYMSYNGRVWDRNDWSEHAREIKDADNES